MIFHLLLRQLCHINSQSSLNNLSYSPSQYVTIATRQPLKTPVIFFFMYESLCTPCSVNIMPLSISEPSAAPVNVRGHNISSTSILVTWDEVPADNQNGIITSYTITYESLTQNHNDSKTVVFTKHETELTGLKKFVNYSITVFASTVKGNGPPGSPIIVTTDQDSKQFFVL